MDGDGVYCDYLIDTLKQDPQAFKQLLCDRWEGEDGPDLKRTPSWTDILLRALGQTPEALRVGWTDVVLAILEGFNRDLLATLSREDRLHWMGAMELARHLPWPEDRLKRLQQRLDMWLNLAISGNFPVPYDFWTEERFAGQPERDPLLAVVRLATRHLSWGDYSDSLWKHPEPDPNLLAPRLWEIALWAAFCKQASWLGKQLDRLSVVLESAHWNPGNLTRFFLLIELHGDVRQVAEAICEVPITAVAAGRRVTLAKQLDYFGESDPKTRRHLVQLRRERVQSNCKPKVGSIFNGKRTEESKPTMFSPFTDSSYINWASSTSSQSSARP